MKTRSTKSNSRIGLPRIKESASGHVICHSTSGHVINVFTRLGRPLVLSCLRCSRRTRWQWNAVEIGAKRRSRWGSWARPVYFIY